MPLWSKQGRFLRYITPAEARDMYPKDVYLSVRRVGGMEEILGAQLRAELREERPSPTSITLSEMEANGLAAAGLGESRTAHLSESAKRERELMMKPAEDFIERAQNKIKAWPDVYDDRAINIGLFRAQQFNAQQV